MEERGLVLVCDSGFFPAWVRSPSSQHAFRHRLLPPRLPLLQGARRGGWRRWGGTATGCTMARAAPACEWPPQLLCSWGRGLLPLLLMLRWCRGLCRELQQGVVLPAADHCTALLHAHPCTHLPLQDLPGVANTRQHGALPARPPGHQPGHQQRAGGADPGGACAGGGAVRVRAWGGAMQRQCCLTRLQAPWLLLVLKTFFINFDARHQVTEYCYAAAGPPPHPTARCRPCRSCAGATAALCLRWQPPCRPLTSTWGSCGACLPTRLAGRAAQSPQPPPQQLPCQPSGIGLAAGCHSAARHCNGPYPLSCLALPCWAAGGVGRRVCDPHRRCSPRHAAHAGPGRLPGNRGCS